MSSLRATAAVLVASTLLLAGCESPTGDETPPTTGLQLAVEFDGDLSQTLTGGMVRIRGTQSTNVSISPGETKEIALRAGTYTVGLEGLSGGQVLSFGVQENVVVTEGRTTTVSLTLRDFVPTLTDFPSEVALGANFTLDWTNVVGAQGYEVEVSTSENFGSIVRTETTTDNSISLAIGQAGTFFFRVRAVNQFGSEGVASDPTTGVLVLSACEASESFSLGQTLTGTLTTSDCSVEVLGTVRFLDFYGLDLEQAVAARFLQRSNNPFLAAFTAGARTAGFAQAEGSNQEVPLNIFLPSGTTNLAVTGSTGGTVGAYEVQTGQRGDWLENCEVWWLSLPMGNTWTIPADISSTDCEFSGDFAGYFYDPVNVWLEAGQTIQVGMSSTEVDSYLELYDPAGELVADSDDEGGGLNSLFTYTATMSGVHSIAAETFDAGEVGSYTLVVTDNPSGAPPAVAAGEASGGLASRGSSAGVHPMSSVPRLLRAPTHRPTLVRPDGRRGPKPTGGDG